MKFRVLTSKVIGVTVVVLGLVAGLMMAFQPQAVANPASGVQAVAVGHPNLQIGQPSTTATGKPKPSPIVKPVPAGPATYTVAKGDSLYKIASKSKTTWQSLYCQNKKLIGNNPDVINLGEKIVIPSKVISCKIVLPKPVVPKTERITQSRTSSEPTTVSTTSAAPQVTVTGSLQEYALELTGSSQQYSCLNSIIMAESSWNVYAENPSGAYGIPQALPGSKMSVAGSDWASNGYTQLRWMVDDYIEPVYGTPCSAWTFHLAHGYY